MAIIDSADHIPSALMGLMNVEKEMIWYCDLVEKAGDAEIISKKTTQHDTLGRKSGSVN